MPELSNSTLHTYILNHIIENQEAPTHSKLVSYFQTSESELDSALHALADYHGIVLHPNSTTPWVIHPFSLAPTLFSVRGLLTGKQWWSPCAWCSFGAAQLLDEDVEITTTLAGDTEQVLLHVINNKLVDKDYVVHFPVPMRHAWDNVTYTCSVILLFRDEVSVDQWCLRTGITKGDVQPAAKIFALAHDWYGNYLHEDWEKLNGSQAKEIFEKHKLTNDIWNLEESTERF